MRDIKPAWRICRAVRTYAGIANRDIPNRLGSDITTIHADTAELALEQARAFGLTGNLVAISEMN